MATLQSIDSTLTQKEAQQKKEEEQREKQLQKDQIHKDIAIKAKPTCATCGRFLFEPPSCPGHSGGGSGESESGELTTGQATAKARNLIGNTIQPFDSADGQATPDLNQQSQQSRGSFNSQIISNLLANGYLSIVNDTDHGILTIEVQCNAMSEESKIELQKYMAHILKEFAAFKNENGISANCNIERDQQGNILSLRISSLTPTQYDAFIQQLKLRQLLPIQPSQQHTNEKVGYPSGVNLFHPTPLSTNPMATNPGAYRKSKASKEQEKTTEQTQSQQTNSLFSIYPRSPIDVPKPK